MRKIVKLKRAARWAAFNRGHALGHFQKGDHMDGRSSHIAKCKDCGMEVAVNDNPAANDIDIGGTAVALNCPAVAELEARMSRRYLL